MNLPWKSAKPFAVPVLVGVYLVVFWRNISGMELNAAGFPKLLIIIIALLLITEVVREIGTVRRPQQPEETETKVDAAASDTAADEAPVADAGQRLTLKERLASKPYQETIPMLAIIVFLLAYWRLMPVIGAYPSTALFVAGLSLILGYRKPLLIIFSAVVCVIIVGAFIQIFTLPIATVGS